MLVMPNGKPTVADFQGWAQQTFGQQADEGQLNQFAQEAGITDPNNITQDQYAKAQQSATRFAQSKGVQPRQQPQQVQGGGQSIPTTGTGKVVVGVPDSYAAPQLNQFQGQQIQAPKLDPKLQQQRNTVLGSILGNPQTMNQQWQDRMFEQQKEQANSIAKQLGLQDQQRRVSRGFTSSGGENQQQLQEQLASQLLGGRRDIATQAALQNRQDELNALGAANQAQSGDIDIFRAILGSQQAEAENQRGNFATYLQGMMNQEALKQAAQQSQMQGAEFGFQQQDTDRQRLLQEFLARQGTELEQNKFGEAQRQFNTGTLMDMLRFLENKDQFGLTFGENQRQFNNNLGFNWAGLQNNQLGGFLNFLQNYMR